jgi:hypothetical protein
MTEKNFAELTFVELMQLHARLDDRKTKPLDVDELEDLQAACRYAIDGDLHDVRTLVGQVQQPETPEEYADVRMIAFALQNAVQRLLALTETAGRVEYLIGVKKGTNPPTYAERKAAMEGQP